MSVEVSVFSPNAPLSEYDLRAAAEAKGLASGRMVSRRRRVLQRNVRVASAACGSKGNSMPSDEK